MSVWEVCIVALAGFCSGIIKNGVGVGSGIFLLPTLALAFPAKVALGLGAPLMLASDIIGMRYGSLFDATQTMVLPLPNGDTQVQVVSWYDNENSYTSQMVRTIKYFSELGYFHNQVPDRRCSGSACFFRLCAVDRSKLICYNKSTKVNRWRHEDEATFCVPAGLRAAVRLFCLQKRKSARAGTGADDKDRPGADDLRSLRPEGSYSLYLQYIPSHYR